MRRVAFIGMGLLLLGRAAFAVDPEGEQVLARIEEHFARIKSIHVRSTNRVVEVGGLWADQPLVAPMQYRQDGFSRSHDIWLDHPKQKVVTTESWPQKAKPNDRTISEVFFDGQKYAQLDPVNRSGLTMTGASRVHPLSEDTPIHAVGFVFPGTYNSSLANLLSNRSNVTVERSPIDGSGAEWLIQVKSIPDTIQLACPHFVGQSL